MHARMHDDSVGTAPSISVSTGGGSSFRRSSFLRAPLWPSCGCRNLTRATAIWRSHSSDEGSRAPWFQSCIAAERAWHAWSNAIAIFGMLNTFVPMLTPRCYMYGGGVRSSVRSSGPPRQRRPQGQMPFALVPRRHRRTPMRITSRFLVS